MLKIIEKVLGGSRNDREMRKLWPIVEEINAEYEKLQDLDEQELKGKTNEFKN